MKVKGMMKKTTVAALAVVIAAGASGFAAAPASAGTLQGAVSASQGAEETVFARGEITSLIFYNHVSVKSSGHTFEGHGGGGMTPGGGIFAGEIYTDDLPRLFRDTVFYQVNATPVYTNINFFDSSSNLLGHMHTGTISTVLGIGCGWGYWT